MKKRDLAAIDWDNVIEEIADGELFRLKSLLQNSESGMTLGWQR